MKFLFLVRHAKSSWDDAAVSDFDRPLNKRGINDADDMAKRLKQKIDHIDAFISSPALRAKTTAEKFIVAFKKEKSQVIFQPRLYLSPASFFAEFIGKIDNSAGSIAIFSHNPGITDFANSLSLPVKTDNIPTCGIFAVKIQTNSWENFSSSKKEFMFFDYPKLVH